MSVTGDWAGLQSTIRALGKLARVPSRVAAIAAPKIEAEIRKTFAENRDPYGKAWAPHKPATVKRWGEHPLLRLTGEGLAEIEVKPLPSAGIAVTSPSEGLAFSQAGTVNQVPRRFLPYLPVLPKSWRAALEKATEEAAKEATSGAA